MAGAPPIGHEPYNKNGEGGRPVIYTDEFIENEAEEFLKWMKKPDSLYFKTFAFERGYSAVRMSEFAKSNRRFSEVLELAQTWQDAKVSVGALNNNLNSGFSKFFMSNVCGWSEKTESKLSGDSENPLSFLLTTIEDTRELVNDTDNSSAS